MTKIDGPCLCGDPYCGRCGDPGAVIKEDMFETIYDAVREEVVRAQGDLSKEAEETIGNVLGPLLENDGLFEGIHEWARWHRDYGEPCEPGPRGCQVHDDDCPDTQEEE